MPEVNGVVATNRITTLDATLFGSRQLLLQFAQTVLSGLRRRAAYDHAPHKSFLLRNLAFQFFDVAVWLIRDC